MKRKDKPLGKRIIGSISSFALIGAAAYAFFAGASMLTTAILAVALLSICTPVIIDGGSIIEVIAGVFEAFVEGVMAVVDAIANVFNF